MKSQAENGPGTAARCWRLVCTAILLLAAMPCAFAQETAAGWRLIFADDFNRPAIGANWRWVFGNGRSSIRDNAIRISHNSVVQCVVPLPREDARVAMDLTFPTQSFTSASGNHHSLNLEMRGGEEGGGGNQERFSVQFVPGADGEAPALDADGNIRITLDTPHHVVMQTAGGIGSVTVDGTPLLQKTVAPARSEVNRYFVFSVTALNGIVGKEAVLDNFQLWAGPKAARTLPLQPNTPAENRQATRNAADFIDPANPAVGIQQAIDALPPTGGLVSLPAGEFIMRRHLRLRNNVTLCGQGAGTTILKADQGEKAPIVKVEQGQDHCVVTVAQADAGKFRAGDAVCFDDNWGHPGMLDLVNKDCVVVAVDGSRVTVRGTAPEGAKRLSRWFPLLYAHCAEFIEVKDLTLIGGDGGWGGFQSSAVTFGQVAGARITRVQITKWRGDGVSLQTGADAIVTDNTVSNAYNGYHPGTTTQRFLYARNLGLDNQASGLYFCYFNRNGVYLQNVLDRYDGYGWPFDIFNVIAGNDCRSPKGFVIEQGEGGGGVVFNNRFARLQVGSGKAGSPTLDFLVAGNRAETLIYAAGDTRRNMIVGNRNLAGDTALSMSEARPENYFSAQGAELDMKKFTVGLARTTPVDPPAYPTPVLDGRAFYHAGKPDAGFQAALNTLANTGGTLLLPAGRYGLAQPLTIPSGVTLAGSGLGTVLHAATPGQTTSLLVASNADRVTVRDLVILGEYERRAFRSPAILLQNVNAGELFAVDIRGWEGTAVQVAGGDVQVRDCRALGGAGNGFEFSQCRVACVGNIVRECANGFLVSRSAPDSRLEGNIAGNNRGNGYLAVQAHGVLITSNNAGFNDENGFKFLNTERAALVANMAANNNQSAADAGAILLAGTTNHCRVYYNNCQDTQMQRTQLTAIQEEATAGSNIIRFNLVGKPARVLADGQGSMVSENSVE
ncbi:MAG TPA: NosD domain-containing protein [Armatimonadota bacterium]|mgnify:CR=1 FL=1|nr:NosD domain-containing protein [Armatimonadota bacterium]